MKGTVLSIGGRNCRTVTVNTAIVGSGAAGYNAALRLREYGVENVAIFTEGVKMGTSRNTGSDKQTYYKLNLCGDFADSPRAMAEDLFRGKCVDGDIAYAEAALSVPCFIHLAQLGVPFPVNRYGEYVGYKTDHDPRARATSAGPLTSKLMTEYLEKAVVKEQIPVLDGYMVISIIKKDDTAVGMLCLDVNNADSDAKRFVLVRAKNIVFATGGPAGIYADTVYPCGHSGSSGVAFEAGVGGRNLTEWQFGLASTSPRWNVSGTYMQVLPRFVSVDPDGTEHEFLTEYFPTAAECLSMVFKKGYEWPFDCRKVLGGSSIIDLLVYRERVLRGRRVYLDFRTNPYEMDDLPYGELQTEAREYLEKAGACFGTPIERLMHMNAPAVELYRSKGVDITKEMLEIALCAQHNNGGLDIDLWWQTNVPHLFAAGEVAGSHGVYRPGGSALNAGQAGSMRAAQYIARHGTGDPLPEEDFMGAAADTLAYHAHLADAMLSDQDTVTAMMRRVTARMTECGGALRNPEAIRDALAQTAADFAAFADTVRIPSPAGLRQAYRLRDILIAQQMYLTAMLDYAAHGGKSRGSAMYTAVAGNCPAGLDDTFRFDLDDGSLDASVQILSFTKDGCIPAWRDVRPLPEGGGFFENVWREYRESGNVY